MGLPQLRTVGIWTGAFDGLSAAGAQEAVVEIEELGYGAVWFGEAYGREAFTAASLLLAATKTLVVATGIASIWARDAVAANAAARTLDDAFGGRFVLGLGVSHRPLVERVRGHVYERPLTAMRDYLAQMDSGAYVTPTTGERPPRVLAALGPKMLELAREEADGAHPYLVTPEHTAGARSILGAGPALAVEQAVVFATDDETALRRAHAHLDIYTGLPNYRDNWLRSGFEEEDLVRGGSDRLARALVVWGDEDAIAARVRDHLDAGASHVCVQVLGDTPFDAVDAVWRSLAPVLTALPAE